MSMKVGIIRFPGSNCDSDIFTILTEFFHLKVSMLWYRQAIPDSYELLVLPGGFSYGDYLRPGAIASFAPAMTSLQEHVKKGRGVLGICNGFQILCEAKLLPGTLVSNRSLKHICCKVSLKANLNNRFAKKLKADHDYGIPISHSDGNYYISEEGRQRLEEQNQIVFQYRDNPNGSIADIAGISDPKMRVLGMMPHPERAVDPLTGGVDGKAVIESILNAI